MNLLDLGGRAISFVLFCGICYLPVALAYEAVVNFAGSKIMEAATKAQVKTLKEYNVTDPDTGTLMSALSIAEAVNNEVRKYVCFAMSLLAAVAFVTGTYYEGKQAETTIEQYEEQLEEAESEYGRLGNAINMYLASLEEELMDESSFLENVYPPDELAYGLQYGEISYAELIEEYQYVASRVEDLRELISGISSE